MIRILIVEDSPTIREYLSYILESDPDIQVIGTADDGLKAVEMVMEKTFMRLSINRYEAAKLFDFFASNGQA